MTIADFTLHQMPGIWNQIPNSGSILMYIITASGIVNTAVFVFGMTAAAQVTNIAITDGRPRLNEATVHAANPYHKVNS